MPRKNLISDIRLQRVLNSASSGLRHEARAQDGEVSGRPAAWITMVSASAAERLFELCFRTHFCSPAVFQSRRNHRTSAARRS